MKVMVVDDEAIERVVLKKILEKNIPGIVVNDEAKNGRIAVEVADVFCPDIVFMDIKMPGMNGIDAVKEIQQKLPRTKFIMLTAFDTFEYAKEAMQRGVREYLLKPAKKQDIVDAFRRMERIIISERQEREEQESVKKNYEKVLAISQKDWIAASIMDHVLDISFEDWSDLLGKKVTTGQMIVLSFPEITNKEQGELYYQWVKQMIKGSDNVFILGPMLEEKIPVLLLSDMVDIGEKRIKAETTRKVRTIIQQFYTQFHKRSGIVVGIGLPFFKESDFSSSYNEALLAVRQVDQLDGPVYQYGVNGPKKVNKNEFSEKTEKVIVDYVKNSEDKEALATFELYLFELHSAGISMEELSEKVEDFMVVLRHSIKELGIDINRRFTLERSQNYKAIVNSGKSYIQYMLLEILHWRTNQSHDSLLQIKKYIKENYDKNITLEDAAEQVGINPFYFSKLFKETFDISFIQHLTDVRIKKAQEMLLHGEQSIKEICFLVGYKDPNYFSRVFKKNTGFSPKEYKESKFQKQG